MANEQDQSNDFSRRKFIGATAALTGVAVAGGVIGIGLDRRNADAKSVGVSELSGKKVPYFGKHQSGISNDAPASAITCSFNLITTGKESLRSVLQILSAEIEMLTQGNEIHENDRKYPPKDNLVNGQLPDVDELTITIGLGSTIFDDRFGLKSKKPIELIEMPNFPNDRLDQKKVHGDMMIQICAQHAETCLRALRIIMRKTRDSLVLKWLEEGFVQPNTEKPGKTSTRNLLGFKDGTANLNTKDNKKMDEIVWVDENTKEPSWAMGGSYMVVRTIRNFVEHWDRTSLDEQENIFGREKTHGAPLGSKNEDDEPVFHKNPHEGQILNDAHIRLANPRTEETKKNHILRRGFNYSRGFDDAGHLDQGLLFICFQKSLNDGFLTIQNRLNGEPLEEYIQPVGGGFFFALPGIKEGEFLGQKLFD